jgi:hypothetical protein
MHQPLAGETLADSALEVWVLRLKLQHINIVTVRFTPELSRRADNLITGKPCA